MGKVVTFNPTTNEDGRTKAEEVKLEFGARSLDQFYRLRREPFLEMLEDHGYHIVRCRPSGHSGKAKSVDVGICLDASWELADGDTLVLLSDDPIFSDLVIRLCETDIKVILTIFDTDSSDELREVVLGHGGKVVLLNDHLDDLELVFEDDYEDEDDASQASVALQEV